MSVCPAMAGLLYFKFGTQKSGIDHHLAPCIVPAWDWAHQHLAPEAAIMATMAVIMVGVTTRAIASDSFRWGSLTFSVRLPAFLSYLSRCDHRCRKESNKWSEPFSCVQLSGFTSQLSATIRKILNSSDNCDEQSDLLYTQSPHQVLKCGDWASE